MSLFTSELRRGTGERDAALIDHTGAVCRGKAFA